MFNHILTNNISHYSKLFKTFYKERPLFIYQMGKVGSTSIENTLKAYGVQVHHIHFFGQNRFLNQRHSWKYSVWTTLDAFFMRSLLRLNHCKEIRIITLVREPISRNISMMFQDMHKLLPLYYWQNDCRQEESFSEFFSKMFEKYINHNLPLTWFDDELKANIGIDVYQYPFNHEQGFALIQKNHVRLLVLQMEKLNSSAKIIGDFVGVANFQLDNYNRSQAKWYSDLYGRFLKEYRPSQDYMDLMYNSRYMQHFYTKKDITNFRNQWDCVME